MRSTRYDTHMCDYPAYGGSVWCGNNGHLRVGPFLVCSIHQNMLVEGVIDAMRREARWMIDNGRATPGGIEELMRIALADIKKKRLGEQYVSEGRPPVVYFAEREGFVKIGTTVDLTTRLQALSAGGQILQGMTAGPVTLLATIPGDVGTERGLHKRFRRLRVDPKREWFRYEGRLREYIDELRSAA